MKRSHLLWASGASLALAALLVARIAYASPVGMVPGQVLRIRNSQAGQFESATGIPIYLGTIDVTGTSKTNHQATTAFNNTGNALCGKMLLIQNALTVDVRLYPVTTSTATVTNTRAASANFGPTISAGERVVLFMPTDTSCFLAAIAADGSSTGNLDFFELQ